MIAKEQIQLRFALAIILTAIAIGLFFILDYGVREIDYASGNIRTKHCIFGQWYRTTESKSWISLYIDHDYPENWHRMGYTDTIFGPQCNSEGGLIAFRISTLNIYLTNAQANQGSKALVAQFIIDQLNLPSKDDREISILASRSFDCFLDKLPFPEGPSDELTTEEVRETIRLCMNLNNSTATLP